jgi:hypothetical protein
MQTAQAPLLCSAPIRHPFHTSLGFRIPDHLDERAGEQAPIGFHESAFAWGDADP